MAAPDLADFVIDIRNSPRGTFNRIQKALAAVFAADDYDYNRAHKCFALRVKEMNLLRTFNQSIAESTEGVVVTMAIAYAQEHGVEIVTGSRAAVDDGTSLAVVAATESTVTLADGDATLTLSSGDAPPPPPAPKPKPKRVAKPTCTPANAPHIERVLNGPCEFELAASGGSTLRVVVTRVGAGKKGIGGFAATLMGDEPQIIAHEPNLYSLVTSLLRKYASE